MDYKKLIRVVDSRVADSEEYYELKDAKRTTFKELGNLLKLSSDSDKFLIWYDGCVEVEGGKYKACELKYVYKGDDGKWLVWDDLEWDEEYAEEPFVDLLYREGDYATVYVWKYNG